MPCSRGPTASRLISGALAAGTEIPPHMMPLRHPAEQLPAGRPYHIYGTGASGRLCRSAFDIAHGRPAAGYIDTARDGVIDGLTVRQLDHFIGEWLSGHLGDPAIVICSQAITEILEGLQSRGFTGPVFDGQVFFLENLAHLTMRGTTGMVLDAVYGHAPRHGYGRPDHGPLRQILDAGHDRYHMTVRALHGHVDSFRRIPAMSSEPGTPRWINGFLSALDGMAIYAMVAQRRPRRYVEVGSGNSTMFARRAIADLGLDTRIRSIDPQPRAEIDAICDEVLRAPFEEVAEACFEDVDERDLVFIDSSHRAFQGSDVTVFMTEILPKLPRDLVVGIHDIFFPEDYPPDWQSRYYNEQYLLACSLLAAPDRFDILLPAWYVSRQHAFQDALRSLFDDCGTPMEAREGCAFWFRVR